MKLSRYKAFCCLPLHILVISNDRGYRMTKEAEAKIRKRDINVMTVLWENEIVWLTCDQAKERNLTEVDCATYKSLNWHGTEYELVNAGLILTQKIEA